MGLVLNVPFTSMLFYVPIALTALATTL